ncbi:hypothetical protein [Brevibacterium album]|uniref:hypothetical protein n=1 Tax=Brevibacterium album TaxID=417948 RepID=UPI00041E9643|nr:hypothetical protein [Brevibacterium album]
MVTAEESARIAEEVMDALVADCAEEEARWETMRAQRARLEQQRHREAEAREQAVREREESFAQRLRELAEMRRRVSREEERLHVRIGELKRELAIRRHFAEEIGPREARVRRIEDAWWGLIDRTADRPRGQAVQADRLPERAEQLSERAMAGEIPHAAEVPVAPGPPEEHCARMQALIDAHAEDEEFARFLVRKGALTAEELEERALEEAVHDETVRQMDLVREEQMRMECEARRFKRDAHREMLRLWKEAYAQETRREARKRARADAGATAAEATAAEAAVCRCRTAENTRPAAHLTAPR